MHSPAADRNKGPILEALKPRIAGATRLLEIACGSLQHACFMAPHFPQLEWLPTDVDDNAIAYGSSLAERPENVAAPMRLDVHHTPWPFETVDVVYSANMLHISPESTVAALFEGASQLLRPSGLLLVYGPFSECGLHTSEGNQAFDENLRARDDRWGIRPIEALIDTGAAHRLRLAERIQMPANNLLLEFRVIV